MKSTTRKILSILTPDRKDNFSQLGEEDKKLITYIQPLVRLKKTHLLSLILIITGILAMLFIPLLRITSHIHIDYNEGWNAYHALVAWHGKLYGNTFTPVNYPPLSFYLLGLFPNPLIAGRFVALLSLFLCCIFVSVIVYENMRDVVASISSGLLSLSIFLGVAESYVGMNDPQLLAQAVMLGSFLVYLFRKNLLATAFLAVIALFIKHNLLAIPLCICLDLFFKNKKDFIKFALAMLGFASLGTIAVQLSDNQFIPSMLLKREYSLINLALEFKVTIIPILPLMIIVTFAKRQSIYFYYFICSLLVGLCFSIGAGTDVNMYFDLFFSIAILSGLVLSKKKNFIYLVLFQVVLLLLFRAHLNTLYFSVNSQEKEAVREISVIRNMPGNILCEDIELCYYAGKKFEYDPFLVHEAVITHAINDSQTIALLKNHTFSLIQLENPQSNMQERFTDIFYNELQIEYTFSDGFYILQK